MKSADLDQVIIEKQRTHTTEAYVLMDRLIAAKDVVTGLLPLHVKTDHGQLVAADHMASGLDMGRTTSGLVMLSQIALAEGDDARADKYIREAEDTYSHGKQLLANGDYFVHWRIFDDQAEPTTTAAPSNSRCSLTRST